LRNGEKRHQDQTHTRDDRQKSRPAEVFPMKKCPENLQFWCSYIHILQKNAFILTSLTRSGCPEVPRMDHREALAG
jgi:hypothetical protein